ncbi:hypothetical protein GCM10009677_36590 [Sphaerisporangium rubeum]|uniref:Putative membrane protein n=1 Tax=Sphaerisporangium rubeum TaxID=321317 RepID=A0A7X0IEH2_9ACTN|nr:hypothetical protein [Sphaerisporangium rubeum]MBB6473756.1 putative membrane protein [Sphaerisporangium rubeum]
MLVAWALPRDTGHRFPASTVKESYWRRFSQGLTFLRGEPLLLTMVIMVAVTNLLDAAFNQVLVHVWAKESGVVAAFPVGGFLNPILGAEALSPR